MRCVWSVSTVSSTRLRRPRWWRWPKLGGSRESVRRWQAQAGVDAGNQPGVTTEDNTEIKKLKAENKRPRADVEILRAAMVSSRGNPIPATADPS